MAIYKIKCLFQNLKTFTQYHVKNSFLRVITLLLLVTVTSFTVSSASGTIEFIRFEHNKMVNGVKCLSMHFKVAVNGMKGRQIKVTAYIEHPKGIGVPDKGGSMDYCTRSGKVCAYSTRTSTYESSLWKDFVINLPNNEIHPLSGKRTYYIEALLRDADNNVLDRTYCDSFDMNGDPSDSNNQRLSSNNNANHQYSGDNDLLNSYKVEMGYGFKIINEYRNGNRIEITYSPCGMCGGTQRCGQCHGNGGIVSAGYGNYYPCYSCSQTGICSLCKANNGYVISGSQLYDSNGNPIYVPLGNGSYYNGSTSGNGNNDNSSRYGYYDCPTCYGTGTCQTCGGDGVADSYYTGGYMECPNCRSKRGKCSVCNGSGKKYGVTH